MQNLYNETFGERSDLEFRQGEAMLDDMAEQIAEGYAIDAELSEYRGWPGDGSGMDDFEDYNQREAEDYANEGCDDGWDCDEPEERDDHDEAMAWGGMDY